jgi:hypothetical protein
MVTPGIDILSSQLRIGPRLVLDMGDQPDLEALVAAVTRLGTHCEDGDPIFSQIVETSVQMAEAMGERMEDTGTCPLLESLKSLRN